METERIALSQRERDHLKVLHELKQKHLTQVEAAQRLKLTDRHVRQMLMRIGGRGDGGIVHQLRGRPSNSKLAATWSRRFWRTSAIVMRTSGPLWLPNIWPRMVCW